MYFMQRMHSLVCGRSRERRGGQTNTAAGGVEDRVEAFEECLTVDEIQTLACGCANAVDDEVDGSADTTDDGIQGARPRLSIGGELKCSAADIEVQALHFSELRSGQLEESGGLVLLSARGFCVPRERICGD